MKKILFVATAVALCSFLSNPVLSAQTHSILPSALPQIPTPTVLITEVYGGGGNSGAPYNLDFIELYNITSAQIALTGWSLQYYTSTGSTPSKIISFPENAVIKAYSHYLVALTGGSTGSNLPGIDLQETAVLSSTSGKVALYSTSESQSIIDLISINDSQVLVDYVPYGKAALPALGTAMAKDCSATLSASRNKLENGTYVYTRSVGDDFSAASPSPEYSGLLNTLEAPVKSVEIKLNPDGVSVDVADKTRLILMDMSGKVLISNVFEKGEHAIHIEKSGLYLLNISGETHKLIFHP